MRPEKILRFVLINGAAIGLGATVATSCIGVEYPLVAFRCNPKLTNNCPETHFCCSDDPAAEMGLKPDYEGKDIQGELGVPYFSGANNGVGTKGMCVRVEDIAGQGLNEIAAANCPIPCNPTWSDDWITDVCGPARVCCQTVALEPDDCVADSNGGFRPVTGADILDGVTMWTPAEHDTHQDANGRGCLALGGGATDSPIYLDCIQQLTVADQRGFCMALSAGQACPTEQPDFVDACTLLSGGAPPA